MLVVAGEADLKSHGEPKPSESGFHCHYAWQTGLIYPERIEGGFLR